MADQRLRVLQRSADQGQGPEPQARALNERLRSGLITLRRLELAAYCGDPAARLVTRLDSASRWRADCILQGGFLRGLEHWDSTKCVYCRGVGATDEGEVWAPCPDCKGSGKRRTKILPRAALAAAWLALEKCAREWSLFDHKNHYQPTYLALEANKAWLACPCEEHLTAWELSIQRPNGRGWALEDWVPGPPVTDRDPVLAICAAAACVGDTTAREAIQKALIEWALA